MSEDYRDRGLVVWAINQGASLRTIREYFEKEHLPFPAFMQQKDEVSAAYGVRSHPVWYLVGPDQKILARATGFNPEELRAALDLAPPGK